MKYTLIVLFLLAPITSFARPPITDIKQIHRWEFRSLTTANDYIYDATTDASGNYYVAGATDGSLPGYTNAGGLDGFVAKFNSAGVLQWGKQIGTASDDVFYAITVDTNGAPAVGGYTRGAFSGYTNAGGIDALTAKFTTAGVQSWLVQFGTTGDDIIYAATVDSTRNPIFAGSTTGAFSGFTNAGGLDAFAVERSSAAGAQSWIRQMGTAGNDELFAAGIDSSNRTYVAGYTSGAYATFTNAGGDDAYIARLSTAGAINWQQQFGTSGDDYINTLPCLSTGVCYPAGSTTGTWSGQTSAGNQDAWVAAYTAAGAQSWIRQFGSTLDDAVKGGRMNTSNVPVLVGVTAGSMTGYTNAGGTDLFYARYSTAGAQQALTQYGNVKNNQAFASGATTITTLPVAGHSDATWGGFAVLKGYDTYIMSFSTSGVLSVLQQYGSSN